MPNTGFGLRTGGGVAGYGNISTVSIAPSISTVIAVTQTTSTGPTLATETAPSQSNNTQQQATITPAGVAPARIYTLPERNIHTQPTSDILDISENKDKPGIELFGMTPQRPEILSILTNLPSFDQSKLTTVGKLFELLMQTKHLRQETVDKLLEDMSRDAVLRQQINTVNTVYDRTLSDIDGVLSLVSNVLIKLTDYKDSINIKLIPSSFYNLPQYLALSDFVNQKMLFPRSSFESFSNSKIMAQLLFDFKSCLENYSTGLLNLADSDRVNDTSPINIDKTYSFSMTATSLQRNNDVTLANLFSDFNKGLPNSISDRIKLVVSILSKELRVSKTLGNVSSQRTLNNQFGIGTSGNPFTNITGEVGTTIFDKFTGTGTLASTLLLERTDGSYILPLENKYIEDQQNNKKFLPGTSFFFDSIVQADNKFDTSNYLNYVEKFTSISVNGKSAIQSLLWLNDVSSIFIKPKNMFDLFVLSTGNSLFGLTQSTLNKDLAIIAAVFRLANTNQALKAVLFNFLVKLGVGTAYKIFGRSFKPTETLEQLADMVETAVFTVLNRKDFVNPDTMAGAVLANVGTVDRGSIKHALLSANAAVSMTDSNFVSEFINIANALDQAASENGEANYLLSDKTNRTRFNLIQPTTILLMIYELFVDFASKYCYVDLVNDKNKVVISVNKSNNQKIYDIFQEYISTGNSHSGPQLVIDAFQSTVRNDLQSTAFKIADEDTTIENFLYLLNTINRQMTSTKQQVITTFTTNLYSQLAKIPQSLDLLDNQAEAVDSIHAFDMVKQQKNINDVAEKDNVLSLELTNTFMSKTTKLLFVGLPTGFSDKLLNRTTTIRFNGSQKKTDVIRLNIYKKSSIQDTKIYKPQGFLFDMSLFAYQSVTDGVVSYKTVLDNAQFADYQTYQQRLVTLDTLKTNGSYPFLKPQEIEAMATNHFTSYLLQSYIGTLTGLKFVEENFLQKDIDYTNDVDQTITNIIVDYLKRVKRVTITDNNLTALLSNPSVPPDVKDTVKLVLYGNVLVSSSIIKQKILTPKKFERIFAIPINDSLFQQDTDAMRGNFISKRTLITDSLSTQAPIDYSLDAYFVAIETVGI